MHAVRRAPVASFDSDLQTQSKDSIGVKLNTRWGILLPLVIIMAMSGAADVTKTLLGKLCKESGEASPEGSF